MVRELVAAYLPQCDVRIEALRTLDLPSEQRLQWIDGEYYGDEEIDCD